GQTPVKTDRVCPALFSPPLFPLRIVAVHCKAPDKLRRTNLSVRTPCENPGVERAMGSPSSLTLGVPARDDTFGCILAAAGGPPPGGAAAGHLAANPLVADPGGRCARREGRPAGALQPG